MENFVAMRTYDVETALEEARRFLDLASRESVRDTIRELREHALKLEQMARRIDAARRT